MNGVFTLTLLTAVPLVGAVMVAGLGGAQRRLARRLALGCAGVALLMALGVASRFDPASGALQLVERRAWIPALGVDYFLGIDGLGLMMVLLTGLLVPWSLWLTDEGRPPLYYALVLGLEAGLLGTFTALNFFHWFLFWELSLVPAYFLVKLWGGPARGAAALQFFLYTMVGSVALLLGFLALHRATGTFDFLELATLARAGGLPGGSFGLWIFAGVFLGFAVKIPLAPFHTWVPLTYAEAPPAVTVLLTGLMSKMGVYGVLRILVPLFPEPMRALLPVLLGMALLTIVATAGAACVQRDPKRMLAYSSVNHLGYCVLGIAAVLRGGAGLANPGVEQAAALNGVVLQMVNHGITAGALFGFVALLERRTGEGLGLGDFGGVRQVMPVFAGLMGVALFSSLGLPGLNGFVGEFLIFKGSFPLAPWATAGATLGLLLTAVFLLRFLERVFLGPLNPRWTALPDLDWRERLAVAPLLLLMVAIGVYPQVAVGWFNATTQAWLRGWGI